MARGTSSYDLLHSVSVVQDNEQQPLTTTQILLVKLSVTPGHFSLIKVVRLSDKSHDGAGSLSRRDGLSVMMDDTLIIPD